MALEWVNRAYLSPHEYCIAVKKTQLLKVIPPYQKRHEEEVGAADGSDVGNKGASMVHRNMIALIAGEIGGPDTVVRIVEGGCSLASRRRRPEPGWRGRGEGQCMGYEPTN